MSARVPTSEASSAPWSLAVFVLLVLAHKQTQENAQARRRLRVALALKAQSELSSSRSSRAYSAESAESAESGVSYSSSYNEYSHADVEKGYGEGALSPPPPLRRQMSLGSPSATTEYTSLNKSGKMRRQERQVRAYNVHVYCVCMCVPHLTHSTTTHITPTDKHQEGERIDFLAAAGAGEDDSSSRCVYVSYCSIVSLFLSLSLSLSPPLPS